MNFRRFLHALIFTLIIISVSVACTRRPDNVLSRKKMEQVLTDLHKLDGTLMAKGLGFSNERENVYYYNQLLAKHGVTQAQFDSSLVYYTRKPKIFQKIYLRVIDNITAFDQDVKDRKYHPIDSAALRRATNDMWQRDRNIDIKVDSMLDKTKFSIPYGAWWQDLLTLKFRVRIAPNDSATAHHAVMRIHYADSTVDSVYTALRNDSILRRYQLILRARHEYKIDSITGTLLSAQKHKLPIIATIDSIALIRTYNSLIQDTISNHVIKLQQKNDSIKNATQQNELNPADKLPQDEGPKDELPKDILQAPSERRVRNEKQ